MFWTQRSLLLIENLSLLVAALSISALFFHVVTVLLIGVSGQDWALREQRRLYMPMWTLLDILQASNR